MNSQLNVVVHDIHSPKINKPAFKAFLEFLANNDIYSITLGGDQLDNEAIAHHNKKKGLYKLPGAYLNNIKSFDKNVLTPIENAAPTAKKIWHIGNHERFEADLVEEQPELQGLVDHVKLLNLRERNWKIIPLGHCSKLGKLVVVHGEILSGIGNQSSKYPSERAVNLYGSSVLAGHTHAPQSFTRVAPVERIQKHMGWIAPCMCTVNPDYLRNKPTAWLSGFTIVEVMPNGNFNCYPVIITGSKFSFNGVIYGK